MVRPEHCVIVAAPLALLACSSWADHSEPNENGATLLWWAAQVIGAVFVIFMQRREEGDRMISLKVVSKAPSCEMPDKAAPDKVHFILEVCFILASS